MPAFAEKYSQKQRDALAHAYEDRKIRPARRVVELAAAGELWFDGGHLPAFETNASTVRQEGRRLRRRRGGQDASKLATQPPRDAIEALRRRLVNMLDAEMAVEEKLKDGQRSPEKLRQLGRAILEAARIPGPTDPRPPSEGVRGPDGKRANPTARGNTAAGRLMQAHRASIDGQHQAPDTPPDDDEPAETGPSEEDSPAATMRQALGIQPSSS